MDDSVILRNGRIKKMNGGFVNDLDGFSNFSGKNDVNSGGFANVLKLFLLKNVGHGVDTLFLAPKCRETNNRRTCSCARFLDENGNGVEERSKKPEFSSENKRKVCEKEPEINASRASLLPYGSTSQTKEDYINVSKGVYDEFPLNFITFFAVFLIKSLGFQINILSTFLTIPLYLSYFWFTIMIFPFQTLKYIRSYLMKQASRRWEALLSSVSSFVFERINVPKSVMKMAVRISRAFLCSIYVYCVLMGLLVSGFVMGILLMKGIVEEPVQATRTLNFDYANASPVAFVPMMSHDPPSGFVPADENAKSSEVRPIPYNHNLQLTVSLTMPESEYNRNLGVFQVKVEFLSTNGKVTATQSHPCILRYKSRPIRHIQTFIKVAPLLVGFESESQTLNVKMGEFKEGLEPTACMKVSLVQRAEFRPGAGIPEIHAATLAIESELPQLKRMIWIWRRTVLVWTSFVLFLMELVLMLLICRPMIIPRGRQQARLVGIKEDSQPKAIAWYKGMVLMMIMT